MVPRRDKLRILMLNYEYPPLLGGAANATYYLLKEFSKNKDLEIDLVTCSVTNRFEIENFSSNIKIYKVNINKKGIFTWDFSEVILWTIKSYFLTRKLARRKNYNLFHCWFGWPPGIIGYLLHHNLSYMVSLRGSDVPGHNPKFKYLDMFVFKRVSRVVWGNAVDVITNSNGLKDEAERTLKRKMDIICNGVDTRIFKPGIKKKHAGLDIISVGRLDKIKGYQYLIGALDKGMSLTLIGDGDYKEELQRLAREKNADVTFKGWLNHKEIACLLSKSDVFVLPSLSEGMSNSILEAMACGLPIITTETGGSKELISGNGVIVKKTSVGDLREALANYSDNPSLIKSHGKKSRGIAEKMGWNRVAQQYLGVYKKCAV